MVAGRLAILLLLLLGLGLGGCQFQTDNSTSEDSLIYGPESGNQGGSVLFMQAQTIIRANCANCHTNSTHTVFGVYSEQDWINNGYVVAGSATTSTLYTKLKNVGGDMPGGGGMLSDADANTLRDWINGISSTPTPTPADPATARALAAMKVLNAQCIICHSGAESGTVGTVPAFSSPVQAYIAGTSDLTTLNNFFAGPAALVVRGNASTSWLYRSLIQYGNINSMPYAGSAISAPDAQALQDWINQMGN